MQAKNDNIFTTNILRLLPCSLVVLQMSKISLSRAGEAEWFTAPCLLHVALTAMGSSPEPPPMLMDMSAVMWIKKAQLPC